MTEKMGSFVRGLAAGMVCHGKMPHIEPVACLYGEFAIRLPPLPTWDREGYPYALIEGSKTGEIKVYYLFFAKNVRVNQYGMLVRQYYETYRMDLSTDQKEWEYDGLNTTGTGYMKESECVWASENIYDSNGALYLAGGDPVPIYE